MHIKNTLTVLFFIIVISFFSNTTLASNGVVIAVFAHPDDETWISGTLSAIAKTKASLHVVYATSGENGRNLISEAKQPLKKIRQNEALLATKTLGINAAPIFLDFNDASLTEEIPALQGKLSRLFKDLKATIIITFGHDGITGHPDHYAVSVAATHAFYKYNKADELLHIAMSKKRSKVLNSITRARKVPFELKKATEDKLINISVNTAEFANQRINAINAHQSQFPASLLDAFKEFVDTSPCEELIVIRNKTATQPLEMIATEMRDCQIN